MRTELPTSKVFIRDVMSINHSIIDPAGRPVGGSYNVDVEISGRGDIDEIIKTIRGCLDYHYNNRLWIVPHYSGETYVGQSWTENYPSLENGAFKALIQGGRGIDWKVKRFDFNFMGSLNETVHREFQHRLWKEVQRHHEITQIEVFLRMKQKLKFPNQVDFSCVRPDQSGFIGSAEWASGPKFRSDCFSCQAGTQQLMSAVAYLDEAVLINRSSIISNENDWLTVEFVRREGNYDDLDSYKCSYNTTRNKIVILDFDPTIERLGHWFVNQFQATLEAAHVDKFLMSEGPSKAISFHLGY